MCCIRKHCSILTTILICHKSIFYPDGYIKHDMCWDSTAVAVILSFKCVISNTMLYRELHQILMKYCVYEINRHVLYLNYIGFILVIFQVNTVKTGLDYQPPSGDN